jgi:ABC-type bacteriocin/lantibiotic exporter with double-glycine peptidase domain
MLLDYHGIIGVCEAELRRILKTKPKGTHLINLLFLKDEKRWSLDVQLSGSTPAELFTTISHAQIPVIVFVDTAFLPYWDESTTHVVLVVGYDEESVIINDPFFDAEEIRVPSGHFFQAWGVNGYYMVVIKKSEVG